MSRDSRPQISRPVRRKVRQKCRFACINPECRCPIWDYEHIDDYAKVNAHREENLVLLCPTCNQGRKGGQFSRERIFEWLKAINKETRPERLYFNYPILYIGGNMVPSGCMDTAYIFQLGRSYLHIAHENEESVINAEFWNSEDTLSLRIKESRYTLNTDVWDIDYKRPDKATNTPGILTFRNAPRDTFLTVEFQASQNSIGVTGKFWPRQDVCLELKNDGIYCGDVVLAQGCTVQGAELGFWVRDGYAPYSSIGAICGLHNVAASCVGIVDAKIGFVWDIGYLADSTKLGMVRFAKMVIVGRPLKSDV